MPTSGPHISGRAPRRQRPRGLPVPRQEDELLRHDAPLTDRSARSGLQSRSFVSL
jgi:hypothetical protein